MNDKIRRSVFIASVLLLLSGCGNGINQTGNALTGDSGSAVDPNGGSAGNGDWVALESLYTSFNSNSIGTVRLRARDRNDAPHDGLSAADFVLYEDRAELPAADSQVTVETFSQVSGQVDTVLLLDISASIGDANLETVKQGILSALVDRVNSRGLLVGQRLALYVFDSRVRRVVDFTDDTALLRRAIESVERSASPSANVYGAVSDGAREIEETFGADVLRTGAVILITDGRDTANRMTLATLVDEIGDKLVYTVGVGSAADSASLALIGTAGSLIVSDFSAVSGALLTVRSRLQQELGSVYELRYASPKRRAAGALSESTHVFELGIDNNSNAARNARISAEFNSYDFTDVRPEVRILGDRQLNVGETVTFTASTAWSADAQQIYSWSLSGNGCSLASSDTRTALVLGAQRGSCQLLAVDTSVSASSSVALTVDQVIVEF